MWGNAAGSALGTIVLIYLGSVCLFSTDLEEGLHLLLHELPTVLIAQIDLIFIDDHDPHRFPFFPTGFAHLGLYFSFKLSHEQSIGDRKSTRLNSSHVEISYAVF